MAKKSNVDKRNGRKGGSDYEKRSKSESGSAKRGRSYKNNVADRDGRSAGYRTGDLESNYSNDIEWYNKYPNMFNDATRVPFNKIAGQMYEAVSPKLSDDEGKLNTATADTFNQPGIITMDYVPGIGVTRGFNDAPNRAFKSLWSALYSRTTGIINFPVHVLASIYCVQQSIAQNIAYVKRALEVSNTYIANNHNFPKYLLEALGITPDSILGRQDTVRWRLNNYIREFNAMKIPKYIDIFVRHYRMARNVYMDQASEVAQLFAFRPVCYYVYSDLGKYNPENSEYDGITRAEALLMPYLVVPDTEDLNQIEDTATPVSIDSILDVIEEQLISVVQSDDYVQVLGAMQRAFDNSQFIVLEEVTTDAKLTVKVDDYINYQIHNANFAGNPVLERIQMPNLYTGTKWSLFRGAIEGNEALDLITYQPVSRGAYCNAYVRAFLNTFEDSVDQNWTAEATRLISLLNDQAEVVTVGGVSRRLHSLETCGSEYITSMRAWVPSVNDGIMHYYSSGVLTDEAAKLPLHLGFINAITKFKFAPRIWLDVTNGDSGFVGDIHFWTSIDYNTIRGLNDTCLLSQLSTTSDLQVKQGIPV